LSSPLLPRVSRVRLTGYAPLFREPIEFSVPDSPGPFVILGANTLGKTTIVLSNRASASDELTQSALLILTPRTRSESRRAIGWPTVFHLALSLGLREGEVLGLRWRDIDFDERIARISVSLQRIDKKLQLVDLKTERSRRALPISDNLLVSLRDHRTRQLKAKMHAGEEWQETGLVFTTSQGTPLSARNVIRSYHRLLAKAKIPRHRFHDLRHSCASFLLSKSIPARTVMDILGHSNISLTMNTYSHVMPEMLRDAATAMNLVIER
jgi:integrase